MKRRRTSRNVWTFEVALEYEGAYPSTPKTETVDVKGRDLLEAVERVPALLRATGISYEDMVEVRVRMIRRP